MKNLIFSFYCLFYRKNVDHKHGLLFHINTVHSGSLFRLQLLRLVYP